MTQTDPVDIQENQRKTAVGKAIRVLNLEPPSHVKVIAFKLPLKWPLLIIDDKNLCSLTNLFKSRRLRLHATTEHVATPGLALACPGARIMLNIIAVPQSSACVPGR